MTKNLTAENLKEILWEQFQELSNGEGDHHKAAAMAKMSSEICKIHMLELNTARMLGQLDLARGSGKFLMIKPDTKKLQE